MNRAGLTLRSIFPLPFVLVACLSATALVAQDSPVTAPEASSATEAASLENLSWMAGDWVGTMAGSTIEEMWSLPAADTLMGMFRWHDGSSIRLYEFMSVELEDDGPVLYLRHFGRGLDAWEKDGALVLPQIDSGSGRAVFRSELEGKDGKPDITRLTYAREGSTLTVTLDKSDGEKERSTVFTYQLRQAEPGTTGG